MIQYVPSYKVSVNATPVPLLVDGDVYPLDLYDVAVMLGIHSFKDGPGDLTDQVLEAKVRRAAKERGLTVIKSRKKAHRLNPHYQVRGGTGAISSVSASALLS